MKKLLAVFAVVLGFASVSQAGILIEPYIGMENDTIKDNLAGKSDGTQMGLRLGWTAPVMFWAGLDYTMGNITTKPDVGANDDGKRTTLSAVVGVDFPILVRGWVGYGLSNEIKFDTYGKAKASFYKIGVGFTGLPFVSLNVEMINEKITELDGADLSPEASSTGYVLSVSLPLDL